MPVMRNLREQSDLLVGSFIGMISETPVGLNSRTFFKLTNGRNLFFY